MRLLRLLLFPFVGMWTGKIHGIPCSRSPLAWIPFFLLLPIVLILAVAVSVIYVVCLPVALLLLHTIFRGKCPNCQRRGLRGARIAGDPSLHEGDDRCFHFSECDFCHHQFHSFDDESQIHIPPTDSRYFKA